MCLLFFFSTMMWRLGFRGVRGVYGAAERRHAAPPPSADSAWFLTQNLGFGDTADDGRRRTKPGSPQAPFLRTGNRNGTRISISVFCGFK